MGYVGGVVLSCMQGAGCTTEPVHVDEVHGLSWGVSV